MDQILSRAEKLLEMTDVKVIQKNVEDIVKELAKRHKDGAGRIYGQLAKIIGEIQVIGKNRKMQQGPTYSYRGIDDVYSALNPLLWKYRVVILPIRIENHTVKEITTANGKPGIYEAADVVYALFAEDGTCVEAISRGSGVDYGDKSTGKMMSSAYKYMAFQTFCIPTEERFDVEEDDIEIREYKAEELKRQMNELQTRLSLCKTVAELDEFAKFMQEMAPSDEIRTPLIVEFRKLHSEFKANELEDKTDE